jgi:hypothetical protein
MNYNKSGREKMKLPINLKIIYVASDHYPINTVESTHFIESNCDLEVICSFLSVFSEIEWTVTELLHNVFLGEYKGETESIVFEVL